jgi:hypothetical protein
MRGAVYRNGQRLCDHKCAVRNLTLLLEALDDFTDCL